MITQISASTYKKGYAKELIQVSENPWFELEEKAPYVCAAKVLIQNVLSPENATYEIINNDPMLFNKYGFVIGEVECFEIKTTYANEKYSIKKEAELTIYALEQPEEDITLTIAVEVI